MTGPTIYPQADAHSQWFANAHPGVTMDLSECVLVLHTTEGNSWWDYEGGSEAPTFTLWPGHGIHQHFPVNMSARALVNASGGVQTNTQDCIQIELVGTCDPNSVLRRQGAIYWPEATDAQLQPLADLVRWLHQNWNLPLTSTVRWVAYPASAGAGPQRLNGSQWLAYTGICGHQHVPENDHGDPGNFPIQRLLTLAGASTQPASVPAAQVHATNVSTPAPATNIVSLNTLLGNIRNGGTAPSIAIVQGWLGISQSRAWDAATMAAYAAWQRKCGYSGSDADGTPGRDSLSKLAAAHGGRMV